MINESVRQFVEFWNNRDANNDGVQSGDNMRSLAVALREMGNNLRTLRAKTFGYLVPKNNGHAWTPGFLDEEQPEIAELGHSITELQNKYAELQSDATEAIELCEGFSYKKLEREAHREKQGMTGNNQLARMQFSREARKPVNAGLSMAESLPCHLWSRSKRMPR